MGKLLIIEKVIILKGVDIFSETPEEILVEVAQLLDEIEVKADQQIITKGETAEYMYIIAKGKVYTHKEQNPVASLGEKELFGEMSVLTDEPELLSVTAFEDCLLLTLKRKIFFELISDRPEISRGIIRVLAKRYFTQTRLIQKGFFD